MVEVRYRGVKTGVCSLSGKEGEVFDVEFVDGTIEGLLSLKMLVQLLKVKLAQAEKAGERFPSPQNP